MLQRRVQDIFHLGQILHLKKVLSLGHNTLEGEGRNILLQTSFGVCPQCELFSPGVETYYFKSNFGHMPLVPHGSTHLLYTFVIFNNMCNIKLLIKKNLVYHKIFMVNINYISKLQAEILHSFIDYYRSQVCLHHCWNGWQSINIYFL